MTGTERESGLPIYGSAGTTPGTFTQMAFEVDDLDTVVAELKRHGVVFEDVDRPGLRTTDGIAEVRSVVGLESAIAVGRMGLSHPFG